MQVNIMKEKKLKHLAIIMDGNRRWARAKGLPTFKGHRKGYDIMKKLSDWCSKKGIEIITVFAFSTENWKRSKNEVNYLMSLIRKAVDEELDNFYKNGYKVIISGRIDELPDGLAKKCYQAMEKTKNNTKAILNICLNYGGRAEIVDAVKKIVKDGIKESKINEDLIKKYLYAPDLPEPDIIVRTSGEQRLSGFQIWEGAYSELYFINKHWPDFNQEDIDLIIKEYQRRERRFGGD